MSQPKFEPYPICNTLLTLNLIIVLKIDTLYIAIYNKELSFPLAYSYINHFTFCLKDILIPF
jgi:hypothetical protein